MSPKQSLPQQQQSNTFVDESSHSLEDFSGGLNTLLAPNRINISESPTQLNTWFDNGALAKRLGQNRTSSTNSFYGKNWFGYTLHTGVISGTENLFINANLNGLIANCLLYTTDGITINIMTTAGPGTVTTAVASAVVTGSGTNWSSGGTAAVGSFIQVNNTIGKILTVNSDTQLTLTANFGALNTTQAYTIFHSFSTNRNVPMVGMNSKIWAYSEDTSSISWDGSVQRFISTAPQANFALIFKNYVFTANTTANPSRIQWSALKDPTNWPASNFIDVTPDDGFQIVGMFLDGQSIVILKTNAAYKLSGDTFDPSSVTYTLSPIFTPNDFIVNTAKTVQLFNGVFIMLGFKGMYSYDGAGAISKMLDFDKIRGEFANINISGWGSLVPASQEPVGAIVDGNYWLQVPLLGSGINQNNKELTYVFDKNGAVWKWQANNANGIISDFAYLKGNLYGVNSYFTSGTPGLIQLNTGSSDAQTTAINGTFTTKEIEFKESQRFGLAYVYYKQQNAGNLIFEYSIDGAAFVTAATIDMTAGSVTRAKTQPIVIGQVGNTIQFRLSNNVVAQTFEVYGIEFFNVGLIR